MNHEFIYQGFHKMHDESKKKRNESFLKVAAYSIVKQCRLFWHAKHGRNGPRIEPAPTHKAKDMPPTVEPTARTRDPAVETALAHFHFLGCVLSAATTHPSSQELAK